MTLMISVLEKITKPADLQEYLLSEVLEAIRIGIWGNYNLIDVTMAIKNEADHDKQNKMKMDLPVALFNGTFSYKSADKILTYSKVTAIDVDGIEPTEMAAMRDRLFADPCVLSVFITPSGKGLKAIVVHDNDNPLAHGQMYSQLIGHFGLPSIDKSCKDLARGNYICYDPTILIKDFSKVVPFHFVPTANANNAGGSVNGSGSKTTNSVSGKTVLDIEEEVLKKRASLPKFIKTDESVIAILNSRWKKKRESWEKGRRTISAFEFSSQFCQAGVDFQKALEYLKREYTKVGLEEAVITRQAICGYSYNLDKFGVNRPKLDKY